MVTSRLKSRLSLLFLACTVVLLIFPAMAFAQTAPTIKSDKDDYRPGETVTLTGSNWQPGESVHINVNDDVGQTWSRDADLTADANGNITDQFQLPNSFIATYKVTATGQQSGTATTSFTDGNLTLHLATSEGVGSMSVTYQSFGKNNAPDLTCSTTGSTPGGSPKSVTSGGTASIGIQSFESVKLGNVTTPTPGFVFDRWTTGTATTDSGNTVSGSPNPCIGGSTSGTNGNVTDLYAHFKPSNRAPVANNDSYSVNEDNPLTVAAPGVLANDTDADGDTLTVTNNTSPSHGSVTVNANGSFTYTPANNYNGSDSFNYTVSDGKGGQATGTVNITVNAVNDAPSFTKGADQTVNEDAGAQSVAGWATNISAGPSDESAQTVSFLVTNDNNSLFTSGGQPAVSSNGTLTYTPAPDANGSATVTVRAKDSGGTANGGQDTSAAQTFTITVSAVNDAPVNSVPGNQSVNEDTTLTFNSANSNLISISDVDAGSNAVKVTLGVTHGKLTLSGTTGLTFAAGSQNGTANMTFTGTIASINNALSGLKFDPDANYNGSDTLTITTDDQGNSGSGGAKTDTDTVSITVRPVNDAPVAQADSYSTDEDTTRNVAAPGVLGNDSDVDGDSLTAELVSGPSHGNLTLNANGTFSYEPNANYNGPDSFTYKAKDASVGSNTVTVSLTVNPVNDAPVAQNGSVTTDEDVDKAITLDASDVDGDTLTYSIVTGPSHGTLSGSGNSRTYKPAANYNGLDSFTFKANDGSLDSNTATVNITVNPVNDAPTVKTAAPDDTGKNEGATLSTQGAFEDAADNDALTITKGANDPGTLVDHHDGTWSWSLQTDDNVSGTVTVTASDGKGGTVTDSFDYSTVNVDPEATFNAPNSVDEGSDINLSLTNPVDPGSADTFEYAFDCGSGYGAFSGLQGANAKSCSTNDNGTRTVKAKIKDDDGGVSEYQATVTIKNVAPTADKNFPTTANEGSNFTVSLDNAKDPSTADTNAGFRYAFDCNNGSLAGATYANSSNSSSAICSYPDGPSDHTVVARIIDKDGGYTEYTGSVHVNNVAPKVNLTGDVQVNEGTTHPYTFTITDPGADQFSFVDGYPTCGQNGQLVGTPNIADLKFQCFFPDGYNTTDVAVKVKDDDGGVSMADSEHVEILNVTIDNVPPTVTSPGPQSADEGTPKSFNLGSFSDPGPDSPWSVDVDWGDGSAHGSASKTVTGSLGTMDHTYADNGSYTVKVTVTDKNGPSDKGVGSADFTVNVANVAPTASFNSPDVNEGSPIQLSLTNADDASSADKAAGFQYAFDCDLNDANDYLGGFSSTSTASCPTTDDGTRSVGAKIKDKDEGVREYRNSVTISNVKPAVSGSSNQSANEGTAHSFNLGSFSDPGDDSPWQVSVNWGDGTTPDTFTKDTDGSLGSLSHTYADNAPNNGSYTVTVKVTEAGNDPTLSGSGTFQANVANLDPTIGTVTNSGAINEGQAATITVNGASDPAGANDPLSYSFDCNGNGIYTDAVDKGPQPANSANCSFADDGTFTVNARVTDGDGGSATGSTTVTVNNVAPTATFNYPAKVNEGSPIQLSLTDPQDPGSADVLSYAFDCGSGFGAFSASNTASCPTNDNGQRTVGAKIKDDDGGVTEYPLSGTATVTIENVAPTATFSKPSSVNEGTSINLSLVDPSDPSSADTAAGFTYAFDCGDGQGYSNFSSTSTASCPTNDEGMRSVGAKIKDKDGGISEARSSVIINNVAPSIGALNFNGTNSATACISGNNVTLSFSITDPGSADIISGTIHWGDGQSQPFTGRSVNASHTYGAGTYTVRVVANDGDGGTDDTSTDNTGGSVSNLYNMSGILAPFNPDGTSVWKYGSTIPVKVKITDCQGNPVSGLAPKLGISLANAATPNGTINEADISSTSAADDPNAPVLRYDATAGQYIYNLSTKYTAAFTDPNATYWAVVKGFNSAGQVVTNPVQVSQKFGLRAK